jgi:hypothetical protein
LSEAAASGGVETAKDILLESLEEAEYTELSSVLTLYCGLDYSIYDTCLWANLRSIHTYAKNTQMHGGWSMLRNFVFGGTMETERIELPACHRRCSSEPGCEVYAFNQELLACVLLGKLEEDDLEENCEHMFSLHMSEESLEENVTNSGASASSFSTLEVGESAKSLMQGFRVYMLQDVKFQLHDAEPAQEQCKCLDGLILDPDDPWSCTPGDCCPAATVNADGSLTITSADGSKKTIDAVPDKNGGTTAALTDGGTTTVSADGKIQTTTAVDGTVIVTLTRVGSWTTVVTKPDGNSTTENGSGCSECHDATRPSNCTEVVVNGPVFNVLNGFQNVPQSLASFYEDCILFWDCNSNGQEDSDEPRCVVKEGKCYMENSRNQINECGGGGFAVFNRIYQVSLLLSIVLSSACIFDL